MTDQERIGDARAIAGRIVGVAERLNTLYNSGPHALGAMAEAQALAAEVERAGIEMAKVLGAHRDHQPHHRQ